MCCWDSRPRIPDLETWGSTAGTLDLDRLWHSRSGKGIMLLFSYATSAPVLSTISRGLSGLGDLNAIRLLESHGESETAQMPRLHPIP